MALNRFDKLRGTVHLTDNANMVSKEHPDYDALFKIRPVVKENFKRIPPEEHLSIDEMIIPFKGRSALKQYNQSKPHKWGIKVFVHAGKSGIAYDFEVYVGKGTTKKHQQTSLGISGDIVLRLVEDLPQEQNFKVYFHNWFSSYDLIVALKEKVETVRRWSASLKEYIQVPQPAAVRSYNQSMGGVDLHNMLVELYRIDFKSRRYYMRIFYQLVVHSQCMAPVQVTPCTAWRKNHHPG
ncbi:hypothetical protein AAFF_G00046900 [Aldrovandia affinis]|uniref:PiggyBac transposable element-derived protein domain-containing protein n=1 Tax=Aldrovandia affinis TaxID=143900 RepID=A0AAD7S1W6_9TELE|nr:hypothetical protein AAFF_G00046900 [Aldrovandia affinis]